MGQILSQGSSLPMLLGIDMGIQWVLWAIAAALKTEKFYDLAGSSTFILLTALSFRNSSGALRQKVHTAMVLAWATRLGLFLFRRVLKQGGDSRFKHVKTSPSLFFVYWTVQGVWVMATLMPTLIVNTSRYNPPITYRDYIGWALWGGGFLLEAVADSQKNTFRQDAANSQRWIDSGVWAWSRHPNYLGEILLWSGLCLSASSVFRGNEWLATGSPLFVAWLLTRLSGIPILEKQAMKRWGANPAYLTYRQNTASLIPGIW